MHSRQTRLTLWSVVIAPTVWALHFLLVYPFAAVSCAPATAAGIGMPETRIVVAAATLVAVVVIAAIGAVGWRLSGGTITADDPLDDATRESRQRFLGNATLLLAWLSLVGVIFVALPALLIEDCR